jgi:inositol phosphorylceramide mannosyltransferase catalytic subunit
MKHKIPKIIHQIWYQGEDNIPEKYRAYSRSWKRKHKDYEHLLWSEDDIKELLKHKFPEYINFFNSLPEMIQKIDFAKYCILYTYGGVYVDMDLECLKNLDSLFSKELKKLYVVNLDADIFEKIIANHYGELYNNDWFASVKKHVYWRLLMEHIKNENLKREWYETSIGYIFRTTGPKVFSEVLSKIRFSTVVSLPHDKIDPIKWVDYDGKIDYSKYPDAYTLHHYGSKNMDGLAWQSNIEIVGGIVFSKIKKYWYLFAIALGIILLDHADSGKVIVV